MAKIKETELAEAVIIWLERQHWDVYQEVKVPQMGGVADLVAVFDNRLVWVIECKTSLTWSVIEQTQRWRSHFRSVAVPETKQRNSGRWAAWQVCRQYFKIGVLEIGREWDGNRDVIVKRDAPLMREYHDMAQKIKAALRPQHKTYAKAGSLGGNHWTPYKSTITYVKKFITNNPGCTLTEIMAEDGRWHYAPNKSARSSIRTALDTFESDWCRVDKSVRPWRYYIRDDK